MLENNEIITAPSFSAIVNKCAPTSWYVIEWYAKHGLEYCRWYLENSANYGTILHILCGYLARGNKISTNLEEINLMMEAIAEKNNIDWKECQKWMEIEKRNVRKDIFGWCKFCQDYEVRPIAIEYPVMHKRGRWAGTIDLVCWMTIPETNVQIKAMIDIKSGLDKNFYENHEVQLHAYKPLWDEEWPEFKIDKLFNYGCHDFRIPIKSSVTPYKLKDQTDSENAFKWKYWVAMYHKAGVKIENKTDFAYDLNFSLESNLDEVFETIDPLEHLTGEAF